MVKVFNRLNVQVSCVGNHDLDFGIPRMQELTSRTAPCKWLQSNMLADGQPIRGIDSFCIKSVPIIWPNPENTDLLETKKPVSRTKDIFVRET